MHIPFRLGSCRASVRVACDAKMVGLWDQTMSPADLRCMESIDTSNNGKLAICMIPKTGLSKRQADPTLEEIFTAVNYCTESTGRDRDEISVRSCMVFVEFSVSASDSGASNGGQCCRQMDKIWTSTAAGAFPSSAGHLAALSLEKVFSEFLARRRQNSSSWNIATLQRLASNAA